LLAGKSTDLAVAGWRIELLSSVDLGELNEATTRSIGAPLVPDPA